MNLTFNSMIIENFKSFTGKHRFLLDRAPGLYFVSGKNELESALGANGSGKSTLFDALFWTLTGKTLRLARPGDSLNPWYKEKTKILVEIKFLLNEEEHNLIRTRNPNCILLNGKEVDQNQINNLLSVPEEAIRYTLLIGQFAPLFLDLRAEQQSTLFTELLQLDLWLNASQKASEEVSVLRNAVQTHETRLARLEGQQLSLQEEIKKNESYSQKWELDNKEKLLELEAELVYALEQHKEASKHQRSPASEQTQKLLVQYREQLQRATQRLQAKKKEDTEINNKLIRHTSELNQYTKDKKRYEQSSKSSICPECGQEVEPIHIKQKIEGIEGKIKALDNSIDELNVSRQEIKKEINQLEAEYKEQQEEFDDLHQQIIEQERADKKIELEIERTKGKVESIERQLSNLKKATNPYLTPFQEAEEKLKEIKKGIKSRQARKLNDESLLEKYRFWIDAFKRIRLDIIDETLLELEAAVNKHIDDLGLHDWGIRFATEKENKSGTVKNSFATLIYPPNSDSAVNFESYSGGENTRMQLGCTFGLSEVLLSRAGIVPNIEVLDEVTRHLSVEGIENLLESLRERALRLNRAIYVIDHRVLASGYFDGVMTIVKDTEGSRIVEEK